MDKAKLFEILVPTLLVVVLILSAILFLERLNHQYEIGKIQKAKRRIEEEMREAKEHLQKQAKLKFYEELLFYLEAAWNGFVNQCRIRDRLVELVEKNHDLTPYKGYEYPQLFAILYPEMNEEERSQVYFMRGITQNTLYKYNSKVVQLLDRYPDLNRELPELKQLQAHFNFWIARYNSVFQKQEEMCLVYVGVEDNKPFPKGIEAMIAGRIKEIENN
jgi:hypothetical protein